MVGLLRRLQLAAFFDDLLSDNSKARQRCRAKRSGNRDVGSITAACNHDSTDTRMIVPCIEGVPPAFEKDLEPCAEVHWCGVSGHADIPQIAGAVSGWNVHGTAKSDRQVREVAANADAFLVPLGRSSIASGVVVSEFNTVVNVVTDRLNSLPTASDPTKHRPCLIREFLRVAIPATKKVRQRFIWQVAHGPLLGWTIDFVREAAVRDQEFIAEFDQSGGGSQAGANVAERVQAITGVDI